MGPMYISAKSNNIIIYGPFWLSSVPTLKQIHVELVGILINLSSTNQADPDLARWDKITPTLIGSIDLFHLMQVEALKFIV
jgi:hypothetical protein